jgi:poly(hydroxyalkanoate) depolymerase family esterase
MRASVLRCSTEEDEMSSKPIFENSQRRRIIHGMVAELASTDPGCQDYAVMLSVLGTRISAAAASDRQCPNRLRDELAGRGIARSGLQVVAPTLKALSAVATRGRFTEARFGFAPQRRYMLYEPASAQPGATPLLVLLHGCQQGSEDFAAGTRMNEAAEQAGFAVLYPEQNPAANAMRCWNWFGLQDPGSLVSDAALIAALTRQVVVDHDLDPARVYVAGMSAGGAMAAVLARDYPQQFAALGVHSGVPAGLAFDVFSAIRVMARGPTQGDAFPISPAGTAPAIASIVFHGDEDSTVHPSNGQAIHDFGCASNDSMVAKGSLTSTMQACAGQRAFTRTVEFGLGGVTQRELWMIHGAGHAWAGGSESGPYTDASGPNASREMLRFFLQHRLLTPTL